MRSSVTTTTPFWMGAAPVPSITRAALRTTVPVPLVGFVGAWAAARAGTAIASASRVRIGADGLRSSGTALA
jgi:hypothetical protein